LLSEHVETKLPNISTLPESSCSDDC